MFCRHCGKKLKVGITFCGSCGTKVINEKQSNKKNNNVFLTILKILKNCLRFFLMFCLLLFILVYIMDKNIFAICFILCFTLLIPSVAKRMYNKLKINRIIKYIMLFLLFFVGLFNITPVAQEKDLSSKNDDGKIVDNNVDENLKKDNDESDELKVDKKVKNNIVSAIKKYAYIKKNSNGKIIVDIEKDGYVVTIPFDSFSGYGSELSCASDGIKVINNIKKDYKDSVDNKISKYILEFYYDDIIKFESVYVNTNKSNIVDKLSISSDNGTEKTISQNDIDKYYKDLINNATSKPETTPVFDENNINQSISCNGKKITIKRMKRVTKSQSGYVPVGKEWVGIYVVFENKSNEDIGYYENDFKLINSNGQVIGPMYNVIKGVFDHERLNNGTLVSGGIREGYVVFANDIVNDNKLSLRVVCQDNLIFEDEVVTKKLY